MNDRADRVKKVPGESSSRGMHNQPVCTQLSRGCCMVNLLIHRPDSSKDRTARRHSGVNTVCFSLAWFLKPPRVTKSKGPVAQGRPLMCTQDSGVG